VKKSPKNGATSRDFKAEYYRLAEQLINLTMERDEKGVMLVSENDIQNYHERIKREIQRLAQGKQDVFEQLYDQRVRSNERFEMLKTML
jgi:hypothetical protein